MSAALRSVDMMARVTAELHELGGLGSDDSLRASFLEDALRAIATLADGHETLSIRGGDLAALAKLAADEAARVHLRQLLDGLRADLHRPRK